MTNHSNDDEKREGPDEIHLVLRPKASLPRLKTEYHLERFPATIGRHRANDIELPFDSVSRYHARIECQGRGFRLLDLRSSNGTFVNGRRVEMANLVDQDLVAFGSLEFVVSLTREEPSRIRALDAAGTMVHFVPEEDEEDSLHSIVEADLPEETSRISSIEEEITDGDHFKRAKERLLTFYRLQEILRSTTDERKILTRVLGLFFHVLPVDRGAVLTHDPADTNAFAPIATQVRSGPLEQSEGSIGISKTILMRCMREKVAILTKDATLDDRFGGSDSIMINKIRSAICVPLISYHHVFGFIFLDTSNSIRAFNKDDLTFVTNVGGEVATHLHNIRMLQEKIRTERMAAIGQTITGMAHNIKNILLLTQGGMELMARRLEERSYDSIGETWALVKRGVDRINVMVKDMLDYARARAVEKKRCQVNEMLAEIRETFAEEIKKRGMVCEAVLDPNCPAVMIDADGLDKALVNLLVNAAEACRPGQGRIVLRTRHERDGSIVIEVEDNGSGIPAEVLPRIFAPFFTTKGAKGSGLGLAMTKKFIEDMGGRIEVRTAEGQGTAFVITIQVEPADVRLEATPASLGTRAIDPPED